MPTFIAMTYGCWGKGETPEAAKQAAKKAGSRERVTSKKWLVKLLPTGAIDAYVDSFGSICWKWAEGADRNAVSVIIESPQRE